MVAFIARTAKTTPIGPQATVADHPLGLVQIPPTSEGFL
jgi:hypothetical protein